MKQKLSLVVVCILSIGMLFACKNNDINSRQKRGEEISEFKDGRALCNLGVNKGWVVINESGEPVSIVLDNLVEEIGRGYMLFCNEDNDNKSNCYYIVDENYNVTETAIGHFLSKVNENGNAWVPRNDDKPGFMMVDVVTANPKTDKYGSDCEFDYVDESGLTVLSREKSAFQGGSYNGPAYYEYELVAPDGKVVIPFGQLGFIGNPQNGRILFSTNGHLQYQTEYEYNRDSYLRDRNKKIHNFKDAKIGYIDYDGNVVVPEIYDTGTDFKDDGTADVGIGDSFVSRKTFTIGMDGNVINAQ